MTTLETAHPAVRPLLEDIQRRSLAPDRLLNIHAQMAFAPAVLAGYAGMRRALEELSTLDVRTRSAIMLGRMLSVTRSYVALRRFFPGSGEFHFAFRRSPRTTR
jgi:hypothetical protein